MRDIADRSGRRGVPPRPTMKDVAAHAGVGLKTVSRVVNGEPGVSKATHRRVQAAIDTLGFRRNDSARLLRTGQTASVGLILEDIGDPFYSALTRAVEDVTRDHGSLLFTGSSDEDPSRERELALALCARRVDGLVIIPAGTDHSYLLPEIAAGIAAVFVDRPARGIDADAVLTDNVGGARAGVAHLIAGGHRRIGFIGDAPGIFTATQRQRGYREAMTAAGLPVNEAWVSMSPPSLDRIAAALDRMLTDLTPVTAVFCGNNRFSVLTLRAMAARDRATGEHTMRELAFVGFDDFELADLISPAITVVAQNPGQLGRRAAELLFGRLGGDSGPSRHMEITTRLIPRGSGEIPPRRPLGNWASEATGPLAW